jgi:decaprenylphospho-beta-D-erythro-pentofuranosid-2-ulose 2-reductase
VKSILIIGATSAIAEATARHWARERHRLYLIARDEERLDAIATDLRIRGAESVRVAVLDIDDTERHASAIATAIEAMDGIDVALIAHGTLGDQRECERDFRLALREIHTNAITVVSLLTHLANDFAKRKRGTIAVISSVAGDRGRRSNYVYGTAKGAVTIFLQGLRSRLYGSGVNVLTIKPGLVDTPMTREFAKGALWATPQTIGTGIVRAVNKGKSVIYLPFFWRYIMLVIRLIPEPLFKRTNL